MCAVMDVTLKQHDRHFFSMVAEHVMGNIGWVLGAFGSWQNVT